VKYTLRSIEKPIGVSSYRVTRELPTPIREEVPTVEDLQEVSPNFGTKWNYCVRSVRMKNKQSALTIENSLAAASREKCHSLWHFWNCSSNREVGRQ
jgi:hypothetical protein